MSDKDPITALLEQSPETWTAESLRDGFLSALHKLNDSAAELLATAKQRDELLELVRQQSLPTRVESTATMAQKTNKPKPKKRGRPRKHDDLSWVLEAFSDARIKHGDLPDRPLIRAMFKDLLKSHGLRESRVDSSLFKSKLETFRQLVSEARYRAKRLSIK